MAEFLLNKSVDGKFYEYTPITDAVSEDGSSVKVKGKMQRFTFDQINGGIAGQEKQIAALQSGMTRMKAIQAAILDDIKNSVPVDPPAPDPVP